MSAAEPVAFRWKMVDRCGDVGWNYSKPSAWTGEMLSNEDVYEVEALYLRHPPVDEGLREAAKALVAKIDEVHDHPQYRAVWSLARIHRVHYDGPRYHMELDALRALTESRG